LDLSGKCDLDCRLRIDRAVGEVRRRVSGGAIKTRANPSAMLRNSCRQR
jgi:hypothetical protein